LQQRVLLFNLGERLELAVHLRRRGGCGGQSAQRGALGGQRSGGQLARFHRSTGRLRRCRSGSSSLVRTTPWRGEIIGQQAICAAAAAAAAAASRRGEQCTHRHQRLGEHVLVTLLHKLVRAADELEAVQLVELWGGGVRCAGIGKGFVDARCCLCAAPRASLSSRTASLHLWG